MFCCYLWFSNSCYHFFPFNKFQQDFKNDKEYLLADMRQMLLTGKVNKKTHHASITDDSLVDYDVNPQKKNCIITIPCQQVLSLCLEWYVETFGHYTCTLHFFFLLLSSLNQLQCWALLTSPWQYQEDESSPRPPQPQTQPATPAPTPLHWAPHPSTRTGDQQWCPSSYFKRTRSKFRTYTDGNNFIHVKTTCCLKMI